MSIYYLDSSACIKLFRKEAESAALRTWLTSLTESDTIVSSDLMKLEVTRAVNRYLTDQRNLVMEFFKSVVTLKISNHVLQVATALQPLELGSLDAIHLASATLVCSENDYFLSYDKQLCAAAVSQGLQHLAPRD